MTDHTGDGGTTRRRNSAQSRELLLVAATELFAERGYESTTIREVGARAGVDAALIARYFGSKAQLYLATMRLEEQPGGTLPIDVQDRDRVRLLLERVRDLGASPSLYAAVRPHEDEQLQNAAEEILARRLVGPAEQAATTAGHEDSRLRAEIAVAALAGIVLSRSAATLQTLGRASADEVARLLAQMFGALLGPEPTISE
jgi:AcrR family transcriptional regulator